MSQGDTSLATTLGQIANELAVLRVQENSALASAVDTLRNLLQHDSTIPQEFHTLLQHMSAGLHAVQQGHGDPQRLLEALQAAVLVVEQCEWPPPACRTTRFLLRKPHKNSLISWYFGPSIR